MTTRRFGQPRPETVAFVAAALVACAGQSLLGRDWPIAQVALIAPAALALVTRPEQWTTALLLTHLCVAALGRAPADLWGWFTSAVVSVALVCLHTLAVRLPWRHHAITSSTGFRSASAWRAGVIVMLTGSASLLGTLPGASQDTTTLLALAALPIVIGVAIHEIYITRETWHEEPAR